MSRFKHRRPTPGRRRAVVPFVALVVSLGALIGPAGAAGPFGNDVNLKASPTILRIGGPGLVSVTLTFGVYVTNASDGTPAVGENILFTQKNVAKGASGHPEMDPNYVYPVEVCNAVTDAKGYATCRGTAKQGSVGSLLTEKFYANYSQFVVYQSVRLPVVGLG
ncbi:MAG: Ig-like domain repeat protein [Marmoricola sp.]|nr:Ig-like domain repeat protein [Marmoricola sp.]